MKIKTGKMMKNNYVLTPGENNLSISQCVGRGVKFSTKNAKNDFLNYFWKLHSYHKVTVAVLWVSIPYVIMFHAYARGIKLRTEQKILGGVRGG